MQTRLNNAPSLPIGVFLQSEANALESAAAIKKALEEASKNFPEDMTYTIPYDSTDFITASIEEVVKTFVEALILVILIIFLFLQNWRATIIPLIAVPVSIVGAFAGMYALGFSINLFTLFGLVLAIGIVVDGEMQIANNQAISLWHLANEIQDNKYLSNLSRYLGTLSWGIIQVKNHKYIEGISSIIVTIKYLIYEAKEVFPFIEDALRVLNIWIQENKVLFREKEIDLFMHLFNSLVPNQEKNEVIDLVRKEDWINIYNKLGHRIYNTQEYTSEWGLDFYNYNLASSKLNKLDLNLIMNNVQNLVTALATRIDVRAKLLYGLSDILFKYKLSEDTFQQKYEACLKLLIVSVEDTEEKRKQFTNSYERAFLSDEYRKTYKLRQSTTRQKALCFALTPCSLLLYPA
jgi:hypothetical protein